MIYQTKLIAGMPNTLNGSGRYFYLVTAADQVRLKFVDTAKHTVNFESPMREGMSADFDFPVSEIQLHSATDQYVEYWFSNTKLDYSRLAMGGASAQVASGKAVCELGYSLAIPGDFRRKSINLQALTDVTIGGIGVTEGTGYSMKAGESLKLGTRGDIYTYLPPARIDSIQSAVTFVPVLAAADTDDANGYQHVDILNNFFYDKKTGNIVTGYGRLVYSVDGGATFNDAQLPMVLRQDPSNYYHQLGQTDSALYIVKGYYGRIGVSYNGGKSWEYLASVYGGTDNQGGLINGCGTSSGGWVSGDGKNIVVVGNDGLWESFNAGKTWERLQSVGYTSNWSSSVEVTKAGDLLYLTHKGGLWVYDYSAKGFIEKYAPTVGGGESSLAVMGAGVYWFNESHGYLNYSPDGGDTIESTSIHGYNARYIAQYGASVIIGGRDKLGFIRVFGDEILEIIADTPSGKWRGDRIIFTSDSIIVKQAASSEDTDPKATVYPMAALAGAVYPAPLQWLAELN